MRSIAPLALLFFSAPSFAGGVGLMVTGGVRGDRAYYYNAAGQQGIDNQTRPNAGFGAELILGDTSDRITGLLRFYANTDWPVTNPETSGIEQSEAIFPAYDELTPRIDGVATMGVQWGLFGDPDNLQLVATTLVGSGFITRDNLEYFVGEGGIGGTYTINSQLQLAGTVAVTARYRKRVSLAQGAFISVRYLID